MDTLRRNISYRVYGLLLFAYPTEFRQEFGSEMIQVFRDCYRAEANSGSLPRFWLRTLADLVFTAAKERSENSGREDSFMKNLRRDAMAFLGCIGIIVIALLLLSYGRRNDVSSILIFGYALDALVSAGVIGNLIVFLLLKTTKLNPLRTALWTFLIINGALLIVAVLIGTRVDAQFRLGGVLVGYVVSFLFWFGLHWAWAKSSGPVTARG